MDERIKIDRSNWHKPSYLGHYDERATYYEGLRTRCMHCSQSFIFPAEMQKQAYEIEKRYPGWLPSLCPVCSVNWEYLEKEILECEHSWEANRDVLALDLEFLRKWLALLQDARPYGKKHFESRIRMLIKATEGLEHEK